MPPLVKRLAQAPGTRGRSFGFLTRGDHAAFFLSHIRDTTAPAVRNWTENREAKKAYWVAATAGLTPLEALRLGDHVRADVRSLHPEWPTADDRDADIAVHARVAEMPRRAGGR